MRFTLPATTNADMRLALSATLTSVVALQSFSPTSGDVLTWEITNHEAFAVQHEHSTISAFVVF
jgi:hypothetical protein